MRVSSQLQHSESWISRHFEIHPQELAVESARVRAKGGERARKKESERRELKRRKKRHRARRARRRRRRSAAEWSARWCTSIPPFFVLHRVSPPPRLLFRPVLLVAPSHVFKAAVVAAATHRSRDEKCYVTLWPVKSGGLSAFSIRHHPTRRRRRRHRPIFRLIPSPCYPSFVFAVL